MLTLSRSRERKKEEIRYEAITAELGLPLFIKPANQGSSVGVSKVRTEAEFTKGIELAFAYDHKILIEEAIEGREIECSVLGNDEPIASLPGEILPQDDFYSYDAKYIDENGARLAVPAELDAELTEEIRNVSIKAFQALQCEGLARVDVFLTPDKRIVINEINTLPGFTKISMYPKLWEVSGLPYRELISRLIELALERHQTDLLLKSSVTEQE